MNNKYPLFGRNANGTLRPIGTPKLDSYGNPESSPFAPVTPISPNNAEAIKDTYEWPVPVILPRQTHAPEGARTVDLRRLVSVAAGATETVLSFMCLPGATTVVYKYGLILPSGGNPSGILWTPTVDGRRVLQYHGNPGAVVSPNPFTSLDLATGADFSSVDLSDCQILLQPGQTISWSATNTTGAALQMGVRMVGYVDLSQKLISSKFGD